MLRNGFLVGLPVSRVVRTLLGAALFCSWAVQVEAQATSTLQGRVLDAATGRAIVGAQVAVTGTTLGARTAADGWYRITAIPVGSYSVQASALGYAPKSVTGVAVAAGQATDFDVSLNASAVMLQGLTVVSAAAERGSVNRALDEQRNAINVTSAISREEIQRGPDDDAAEAVRRVSGVTVEGGRYVFVRGLGERYTTTQLNGARLPSSEPDRRVVPLDLFPAGTLEGITVSKTFTPDQSGDFTGAQVNLKTRSFGSAFRTFSFSMGLNDAVTFKNVLLAPTVGAEWLGFASSERGMPDMLQNGGANLGEPQQISALSQFRNAWSGDLATASPNMSLSASSGSRLQFGSVPVQLLGAISYQNRLSARRDETRSSLTMLGTETVPQNQYSAETGSRSVLFGGVLNFTSTLGESTRLQLNNTYDRSVDNEALHLVGFDEELNTDLDITRLQFVERSVLSNQLVANHVLGRHVIDWSGTFSRVTRNEPDRSEVVYARETDLSTGAEAFAFVGSGSAPTTRAFGELAEYSVAGQGDYALNFDNGAVLKLGGLYRLTDRDALTRSFDFDNIGLGLAERGLPAEEIFGGRFYQPGALGILLRPNLFGGTYTARENLGAGYAMVQYPVTERIQLVGGARVEGSNIDVNAIDIGGQRVPAELNDVDMLPSVALNLQITDDHALRLSATRTLSRPEFRELANITYREYVGDLLVFGNPELKRALIDNLDARWEMYPASGEVVSIGVFAKRFSNPIERVVTPATGAPVLSFRNAARANNYGVELELRRRLGFVSPALESFILSTNATLVKSEVEFGGTEGAESATSQSRALLGQAPYVLNASLIYELLDGGSATLLFNSVGRRITEVGLAGIPDAYEQGRSTIDFSAEYPVLNRARFRIEAENLLDADTEVRQGTVTRLRYRSGRSLSLGVSIGS